MHVRRCFKLSSYKSRKERREAGAEGGGGGHLRWGKAEQESKYDSRQVKIFLLFLLIVETEEGED